METSYSISGGLPQIEVTPYKGALLNSNRLQLSVLLIIFLLTVDRLLSEPTVYFSSEPLISLPVVIPVSFSDDEDSFKLGELIREEKNFLDWAPWDPETELEVSSNESP